MRDDEEWRSVWAALTDAELEDRLFKYFWLARNTPNSHDSRLRQLADEAERRGQAAMVERAKLRAATTARNKGDQQAISVNIGEQTEFVHRHGGLSLTPRDRDQAGSHQMTKREAILECRRRSDAGEFNRKIVGAEPEDLRYDKVQLSCGHSHLLMRSLQALSQGEMSCPDCADEWIEANTKS